MGRSKHLKAMDVLGNMEFHSDHAVLANYVYSAGLRANLFVSSNDMNNKMRALNAFYMYLDAGIQYFDYLSLADFNLLSDRAKFILVELNNSLFKVNAETDRFLLELTNLLSSDDDSLDKVSISVTLGSLQDVILKGIASKNRKVGSITFEGLLVKQGYTQSEELSVAYMPIITSSSYRSALGDFEELVRNKLVVFADLSVDDYKKKANDFLLFLVLSRQFCQAINNLTTYPKEFVPDSQLTDVKNILISWKMLFIELTTFSSFIDETPYLGVSLAVELESVKNALDTSISRFKLSMELQDSRYSKNHAVLLKDFMSLLQYITTTEPQYFKHSMASLDENKVHYTDNDTQVRYEKLRDIVLSVTSGYAVMKLSTEVSKSRTYLASTLVEAVMNDFEGWSIDVDMVDSLQNRLNSTPYETIGQDKFMYYVMRGVSLRALNVLDERN